MYIFEDDDEIYKFVEKILNSKDNDIKWVLEFSGKEFWIKKEYLNNFEFLYQRGFIFQSSINGNYLINRKGLEFFYKYKGATMQELNLIETQELAKNSLKTAENSLEISRNSLKVSENSLKITKISLVCSFIFGLVTILPILIDLLR